MKKRKIIAFDFDGVIADSFAIQLEAALEIINDMGVATPKMSMDEMKDFVRKSGHLELLRLIRFPIIKIPKLLKSVKKQQGEKINLVKIFNGIESVLNKMVSKYDVYLLTGNSSKYINPFLKRYKIDRLFKEIYSDVSNKGKKSVFENFYKDHKDEIEGGYYIGDEVKDVVESQRIGFKCIASTWGITSVDRLVENNPYAIAKSPLDIMNYIK